MAFVAIPNLAGWEYDNAPVDPGGARSALWAQGTAGIRTNSKGVEIYTNCRNTNRRPSDSSGGSEINKSHLD